MNTFAFMTTLQEICEKSINFDNSAEFDPGTPVMVRFDGTKLTGHTPSGVDVFDFDEIEEDVFLDFVENLRYLGNEQEINS